MDLVNNFICFSKNRLQSVFRETYEIIDQIQTKIKLEQKDREAILENLKSSEFKLNDLKQKVEIVIQQIKERYNTSISDKLIVDDSEDDLVYKVEKIQRSLEKIGPVNMAILTGPIFSKLL